MGSALSTHSESAPPVLRFVDISQDDGGKAQYNFRGDETSLTILAEDLVAIVKLEAEYTPWEGDGYLLTYVDYVEAKDQVNGDADKSKTLPTAHFAYARGLPKGILDRFIPSESQHADYGLNPKEPLRVIISTLSGTGLSEKFYDQAVAPILSQIGYNADANLIIHRTTSARSVSELTEKYILPSALRGESQRILLLSGDGGVVDLVNALLATPHTDSYVPPTVSILPLGTGNALAHSIGLTHDNTWGLSHVARGTAHPLPLLSATFSPGARLLTDEARSEEPLPPSDFDGEPILYGAVVCSWGMHAALVADSDTAEYRKHGLERFQMAAKEALYPSDGSPPHAYKADISFVRSLDEESSGKPGWMALDREEHGYVLATLVSNLEKTFTISPKSKPFDGQLRLVHFGTMSGDDIMGLMKGAYAGGKHIEDARVGYEEIDGLKIEFQEEDARWRRVCVDGKIVRVEQGGCVVVRKCSRRVLNVVRMMGAGAHYV